MCHEIKIIAKAPIKSCPLDPIPTDLFKTILDILIPTQTLIVTHSIGYGVMPHHLNQAVISPILKKPHLDPEGLSNYRPVSKLPFLFKLIESGVADQLVTHLGNTPLGELCLPTISISQLKRLWHVSPLTN